MNFEYLQANIAYNPDTGEFTRKTRTVGGQGIREVGSLVGHKQENGYLTTHARGKQVRLHRLAFYYMTGKMPDDDQHVDHINGIRDDNRWSNLRLATQQENTMNMKLRSDNKSGARGVSYCKTNKKWTVKIKHKGVMHCFGSYADKDEAISVRMIAQSMLQGDWARDDLGDKSKIG